MKKIKRILSFFLVCFMLFLYSVPCFAADNANIIVDSSYFNFDNLSVYGIDDSAFLPDTYSFINTYVNSENTKIYIFPILLYVDLSSNYYKSYILVQSQEYLNVEFTSVSVSSKYPDYVSVNITSDSNSEFSTNILTVRSSGGWSVDKRGSAKIIYIPSSGVYNMTNSIYDSSNYLLFDNGKCVSEKFCAASVDYAENNVVISGLSGFFTDIKNKFTEQISEIKNIPSVILDGLKFFFIPDTEEMKNSFNRFISFFETKFGYTSLIETLKGLLDSTLNEHTSVGAADINESFNYSFGNSNSNLVFSVPFSQVLTVANKNMIGGFLKGVFFILLIFYNLSEIYFLIRGVRPWTNPPGDTSEK